MCVCVYVCEKKGGGGCLYTDSRPGDCGMACGSALS